MAYEVVWLSAAIDDVAAIRSYIATQSITYAANVVRKISAAADDLELFPLMGRRVPEVEELDLRERIVFQYRLIYRFQREQVRIVAVIHGARLLRRALAERDF
jgi:plasmid stabilization system protein ParE